MVRCLQLTGCLSFRRSSGVLYLEGTLSPRPRGPRARDLNIYLLVRDVAAPEDALEPDAVARLERRTLRRGLPYRGVLYLDPPVSEPPTWQSFVNEGLSQPLSLLNRHAGAVLFLAASDHWFVLTFGYGRHLLNMDLVERRFGLIVTLNSVDAELLRSVDTRTVEESTLLKRLQASRSSPLDVFGVDVARDILGGVTGRPRDPNLGPSMSGADSVSLHVRVALRDLDDLCSSLLAAHDRNDYRQSFGWIDHMSHVKDSGLIEMLDDALVIALNGHTPAGTHLAAPEQIAWEDVAGFRYSTDPSSEPDRPELGLDDYLASHAARRDGQAVDLKRLKSDRVEARSVTTDAPITHWSIYRALVFETRLAGKLYVLSGGLWYQIEPTFADEITRQVELIPELSATELPLPAAHVGEREDQYVERAAPELSAQMGVHVDVLDRKLVRCAGAATDVEVCDLLTELGQFIHVKRRTRSSTLSHLFAQGTTSAEAFVSDPTFRQATRARLAGSPCATTDLLPDQQPRTSDYSVVYAIVTPAGGPLVRSLPFLSRVNLSHSFRRLRSWGYGAAVARIDET